jgi:hypothetical protein
VTFPRSRRGVPRGWVATSALLTLALASSSCIGKKVPVTSATAAARPPCLRVRTASQTPVPAQSLPPAISQVADQVQQVRGLKFRRPVAAEEVTQARLAQLLQQGMDESFPKDEAARTGQAWSTIGVIPAGLDLRKAVEAFNSSQVIGFYDDQARRLVIVGSAKPTPYQRFVLSHELTHALQDQNFGLTRLEQFDRSCQDERLEAFLAVAEGDAVQTSVQWATQNLTDKEITEFQKEASHASPPPASVPPFVQNLLTWPYQPGRDFVQMLQARGGEAAVDGAFRNPPVSTEQILHPEKYPADRPETVNVPDIGSKLGPAWKDLEFEDVGEAWLQIMLALHMPTQSADGAAAGWDGAQYRAWTDGDGHTAVVLDTAWDTVRDANEFSQAMDNWLGDQPGHVLSPSGNRVRVVFASDRDTLTRLESVASASA